MERFMDKVSPEPNSGCWLWTAAVSENGYGIFPAFGDRLATRVSLTLFKQQPSKDKVVCHKCDNPICVNPDHLFVGTRLDNARDSVAKARHAFGSRHGKAKLNEEQVLVIRTSNKKQHELAAEYGVARTMISRIKNRKRWALV
jgi:hypothetical protein